MRHAIVCEDFKGVYKPGHIVRGVNEIRLLRDRGTDLLPYDADLPRNVAGVGYVQNFYGDGWLFDSNAAERGCPALIRLTPKCRFVYWAARLTPAAEDWRVGPLRLVNASYGNSGPFRGMRQVRHLEQTPGLDERGGATVYGLSAFDSGENDNLLVAEIYAVARGMLVQWVAMTEHFEESAW